MTINELVYPIDFGGSRAVNKLTEDYTFNNDTYRAIMFANGPAFAASVKVYPRGSTTAYVEGRDYKLTYHYDDLSQMANGAKLVGGLVVNGTVKQEITVVMQILGGWFNTPFYVKDKYLEAYLATPGQTAATLFNAAQAWKAPSQKMEQDDAYSIEFLNDAVEQVLRALTIGDVSKHKEIYDLMLAMRDRLASLWNAHLAARDPHDITCLEAGAMTIPDTDALDNFAKDVVRRIKQKLDELRADIALTTTEATLQENRTTTTEANNVALKARIASINATLNNIIADLINVSNSVTAIETRRTALIAAQVVLTEKVRVLTNRNVSAKAVSADHSRQIDEIENTSSNLRALMEKRVAEKVGVNVYHRNLLDARRQPIADNTAALNALHVRMDELLARMRLHDQWCIDHTARHDRLNTLLVDYSAGVIWLENEVSALEARGGSGKLRVLRGTSAVGGLTPGVRYMVFVGGCFTHNGTDRDRDFGDYNVLDNQTGAVLATYGNPRANSPDGSYITTFMLMVTAPASGAITGRVGGNLSHQILAISGEDLPSSPSYQPPARGVEYAEISSTGSVLGELIAGRSYNCIVKFLGVGNTSPYCSPANFDFRLSGPISLVGRAQWNSGEGITTARCVLACTGWGASTIIPTISQNCQGGIVNNGKLSIDGRVTLI